MSPYWLLACLAIPAILAVFALAMSGQVSRGEREAQERT